MASKNGLRLPILLACLCIPLSVTAQVELVEEDRSAVIPRVGFQWNQNIMEYMGGLEYVVESRTALGFMVSRPLEDTLSFDPNLDSYAVNPYAVFEFIEPGLASGFTFSFRAGFTWIETYTGGLNSFTRSIYSAGPYFGARIQVNDHFAYIPTAGYEFAFTKFQRSYIPADGTDEDETTQFVDDEGFWHDVPLAVHLNIMLNERHAIDIEPRLVLKFGMGRTTDDLINAGVRLAYVLKL